MGPKITVALAGNPNSGKTTIFNNLTGARQHVGNYPGVTVERKEGLCRHGGHEIKVIDLPGTYSLTAYSEDEVVARDAIIDERPDVVVDIIDASNLERNLYLAVEIMELGAPLVLAFNMSDIARERGYEFDIERLSRLLDAPIVQTIGNKGAGIEQLLDVAVSMAGSKGPRRDKVVDYGPEIEGEIERIQTLIEKDPALQGVAGRYGARWLAVKLLENDKNVQKKVGSPELDRIVREGAARIEKLTGEHPETAIAGQRYGFISGACREAVRSTIEIRHTISDRIDAVLTNRVLGIPIFLGLLWLVFQLTFTLGGPPGEWIEGGFNWLSTLVGAILPEGYLRSLITDGVIAGAGGVLVFVPNVLMLFLAIAVLEDSGYMARVAFIMDRLMHRIGLHGKSFIPMLIGFGCNIPAIMGTRTIENERDRIVTILVNPLMSCSARLPVYTLLAGAFFAPHVAGHVIFSIYVLGVVLAIAMAKIFKKYLLPGAATPFVMELPPYRMPTLKGVLIHMCERAWLYIKKAGTIILAISIVMWFLSSFPANPQLEETYKTMIEAAHDKNETRALENELAEKKLEQSLAGRIGHAVAFFLQPIGLGDWKIGTALFAGFGAKEVVVATLGTLYSVGAGEEGADDLKTALQKDPFYSPLVAYTLMVFVLTYVPCMAAVAVVRRETNSWRWPLFMIGYELALAWVVSFIVYWGGRLFIS
ncbi:ferrous iron transport protein B [Dissulfurimicrobium hydrothermale]|uniref:ferrous iron transport protein B n=1 Tax=Dissulfurimicrobium hydrothermale TaxID=1750598 RepID=UPI001EDAF938|nr:ferrous iron transport protein B [Dissulfurimicrobium hydrothermale]UKL14100.1 ferrous iron transport protein B [Dissulfurimicrobium hydrothermale]